MLYDKIRYNGGNRDGMVGGGVVSKLFDILYICLALTLTLLLNLFTLVNNYKIPETAFIAICLNHNFNMSKSWHTYSIGISLFAIGLVSLLIMQLLGDFKKIF